MVRPVVRAKRPIERSCVAETVMAPRLEPPPGRGSRESGQVFFQMLAVVLVGDLRGQLAGPGGIALRLVLVARSQVSAGERLVRVRNVPVGDLVPVRLAVRQAASGVVEGGLAAAERDVD